MCITAIVEHKTVNDIDFGTAKTGLKIGVAVAAGIYSVVAFIALLGYVSISHMHVYQS